MTWIGRGAARLLFSRCSKDDEVAPDVTWLGVVPGVVEVPPCDVSLVPGFESGSVDGPFPCRASLVLSVLFSSIGARAVCTASLVVGAGGV